MSVQPRGNKWQADVKVKGHPRMRKPFPSKEEAEAWEAQVRLHLIQGIPLPRELMVRKAYTLAQGQTACYKMYWENGKSDQTMLNLMGVHAKFFGAKKPMDEFTTDTIDDYILHMKSEKKSGSTINRHLACLSKIFSLAAEQGKITGKPHFHRQQEGEGRIRYLINDEEPRIVQTLRLWSENKLADAVEVLVDTGLRKSELIAITQDDLSADGLYVSERKGMSNTVVPLTQRARKILNTRVLHASVGQPIFGDYYKRSTWERMQTHTGLTDVGLHTLRHTCCSRLVQGGMPLVHVKEWMGHKNIQTTMRYAHLAPTNLVQGIELLENRA